MFKKVIKDINNVNLDDLCKSEIEGNEYAAIIDDKFYFLFFKDNYNVFVWRKGKYLFGRKQTSRQYISETVDLGCFKNKESAIEYMQGKSDEIYIGDSAREVLEGLFYIL